MHATHYLSQKLRTKAALTFGLTETWKQSVIGIFIGKCNLIIFTVIYLWLWCMKCLNHLFFSYWTLDVSRTASYEINLVCLPVRPSLSFLKIGSLVFSDIVHDNGWPWYLVNDEARFLKKSFGGRIWAKWTKIGPKNMFFVIFSSLFHYFSLKLHIIIACNNV